MPDSSLRRAAARVHAGKALDEAEALVLLGARGEDLESLFTASARVRDAAMLGAGDGLLFPQGFHPFDPPLSGFF